MLFEFAHGSCGLSIEVPVTMTTFERFVSELRPAVCASLVATVFGLSRRRFVSTDLGTFFINPISAFGSTVLQGEYEPHMRMVLSRYLSPGGVFIDVGSNEGYFCVLASKLVGPKGTVIAVEPQSRLQHVIQANLEANECFNVRLIRCVVSDKSGTMRLSLAPDTNTGASSLFRPTRYPLPTENVRSFSLVDLLDRLGIERCDLMKVDIEGAEYDVFMASSELLRNGIVSNIALEFHPHILSSQGLSAERLHKHMIENGYALSNELGNSVYSFVGCAG